MPYETAYGFHFLHNAVEFTVNLNAVTMGIRNAQVMHECCYDLMSCVLALG